jgi:hypothetical protein
MPQLSLYIDADILKKIEVAAKIDKKSISKWVSERLGESFENNWPANYESLFGCIDDDTFNVENNQVFSTDAKRESL